MEEERALKSEMVETNVSVKPKRKFSKIIIFCAVILIVAGGVYYFTNSNSTTSSSSLTERTATVDTEDLSTTITGSGSMLSSTLMNVSAKTNGTIQKLFYKQGDKVKAGAVICQLDASDATTNVQNAQNNLDQAILTQKQNQSDFNKLTSTAPMDGQITNIAVNEGDIVQRDGILYTITDNKNMSLTVPFNGSDLKKISIGSSANINLQNVMQTIKGRVTYISNAPYSTSQGGDLYNVEFAVTNPGSLTDGTKASADVIYKRETISSADVGALTFKARTVIRSTIGGTVDKINAKLYQAVKRGQLIMKLSNQDEVNTIAAGNLKIEGLKQQLANSKKQLSYCTITAPISGEITAISNKEGETLKLGDVLTSVTDVSHMQFTIPVDELDIAKIKVGQTVNVTVDALTVTSTLPLIGKVKDIAVEGSASNGVTTYDVTIAITGVTDPRTLFSRFRSNNSSGQNSNSSSGQKSSNGSGGNNSQSGYGNRSSGNGISGSGNANSGYGNRNSGYNNGNASTRTGSFSGTGSNGSGFSRMRSMFNTTDLLSSLKDGMNANAEIIIADYKNTTAVPIDAITRYKGQSYVMVKSDAATVASLKKSGKYIDIFTSSSTAASGNSGTQASGSNSSQGSGSSSSSGYRNSNSGYGSSSGGSQTSSSSSMSSIRNSLEQYKDYYKDSIPTPVEVGVNNSTSIQIVSGVKVGDVVLLPPLVAASKSSSSSSSLGGFGGMGGGFGGGFGGGQNNRSGGTRSSSSSSSSSSRSGGGN